MILKLRNADTITELFFRIIWNTAEILYIRLPNAPYVFEKAMGLKPGKEVDDLGREL